MAYEQVQLNVGGVTFRTYKETLTSCVFFKNLFKSIMQSNASTEKGETIVDRNGALFEHVLDYLRIGNLSWIKDDDLLIRLKIEAEFYGLESLQNTIEQMLADKKSRKKFEIMTLNEFMMRTNAQGTIESMIKQEYFGEYRLINVIHHKKETWVCPRYIYVHKEPSHCGRKCDNALNPEVHGKQYVAETSVVVVFDN